jgi:hypothetical protein
VTLFGGREKMGKSFLAFGLCIAVATGGFALGKMPVEKGGALYLSLEDPERRLHKRICTLASDDADLSHFHYATEWNPADQDGVKHLDMWLEENKSCRLLVIDSLKRIRPRTSGRRNPYETDYEALQPFVSLSAKHNVACLVVHHLNQQAEPNDPFDAFSGSSGLTAAAEHIWLLTRKRGDCDAYLRIDGKDIEEPQELALGWDGVTCTWTVQGDAQTYRLNKERREIVEFLEREDGTMGPKEVADALGRDYNAVRQMMSRMHKDGQLNQEGYGKYVASRGPGHTGHSSHTSANGSGVTSVNTVTSPSHEGPRHDGVDDVQETSFSGKQDSEQKSLSDREGVVVELQTDNISSSLAARSAPPGGRQSANGMTLVGTAHVEECIHGFVGGKGCYLHDPEHPYRKRVRGEEA